MCYIWKNPTEPKEEVSLETLSKLPAGFDNLNVSGGEPTLRKDLGEIADLLHPKARVMEISSNGLHPERLVPIIKKYPNIKVRFSLEGDQVTNDAIRGEKNGYATKVAGLRMLKEAGGTDLGFAMVIQDENVDQLVSVYEFARREGYELATSALHNAWQFYKNDNYFYDRKVVARKVEGLIEAMLRSSKPKNWFRAYLNLGLIEKILGHDRLIPCTAGKDFAFIDPPYKNAKVKSYDDTMLDHTELVKILLQAKFKWLLTEYRNDVYQPLTEEFGEPLEIEVQKTMENSNPSRGKGKKGKRRKVVECLWKNY